jgi:hypothetical protein
MGIQNYLYLSLQLIAVCFAIYYWKNYRKTHLWIFLPFLVYTFLNELMGTYIALNYQLRVPFNIYIIVSFFVYLYWYDQLLRLKFWKWIILGIFCAIVVYDIQTRGFLKPLLKTAINFQSIMVLGFSFLFFAQLLRKKEVVHYQKLPEFWIVTGILLFYIGYVPLSLVIGMGYNVQELYAYAIIPLNFILYGGYIIGFYVSGKR